MVKLSGVTLATVSALALALAACDSAVEERAEERAEAIEDQAEYQAERAEEYAENRAEEIEDEADEFADETRLSDEDLDEFARDASDIDTAARAPINVRGTVNTLDGETLMLTAAASGSDKVMLTEETVVYGVNEATIDDLAQGLFIGTATVEDENGNLVAREVTIFPDTAENMEGPKPRIGHFEWDLEPGSKMTNATVAEVMEAADGQRKIRLSYEGEEKVVIIPEDAPIVRLEAADRALLVEDAKVFVVTRQDAAGEASAVAIIAEKDGVVPPL